jgi:hypothetical protein
MRLESRRKLPWPLPRVPLPKFCRPHQTAEHRLPRRKLKIQIPRKFVGEYRVANRRFRPSSLGLRNGTSAPRPFGPWRRSFCQIALERNAHPWWRKLVLRNGAQTPHTSGQWREFVLRNGACAPHSAEFVLRNGASAPHSAIAGRKHAMARQQTKRFPLLRVGPCFMDRACAAPRTWRPASAPPISALRALAMRRSSTVAATAVRASGGPASAALSNGARATRASPSGRAFRALYRTKREHATPNGGACT